MISSTKHSAPVLQPIANLHATTIQKKGNRYKANKYASKLCIKLKQ